MGDRFLIVRLGAIGDVVHTLPLAAALRDARPNAHIAWAVGPGPGQLLLGNPDVDEIITIESRAWRKGSPSAALAALMRDFRAVREARADVALDPQGLIKSGLLAWASGAPVRVGFDHRSCREGMNVVFTTHQEAPPAEPHHVVEKNLSLLPALDIDVPPKNEYRFPLPETKAEAARAEAFLKSAGHAAGRPLLVVHPGGGWETKLWEPVRFARLADWWAENRAGAVLLIWGPGERGLAEQVADAMRADAILAPETGVREMMALIKRGACFAGGDSGPAHLAAAMGVRCLMVMGPTDPVRNGPFGTGHHVLHHQIACSGCYARKCPDIECMDRVGVAEAQEGLRLLYPA